MEKAMRGLVLEVALLGAARVVSGQKPCAIDLVGREKGAKFHASRADTKHGAVVGVTDAVVRREIRPDLLRVDLGRAGCTVDKKGFRQKKPSGVILEGRRIHRLVALLRATSALAIHLARERQVGMGVGPTRNVRENSYEIWRCCQGLIPRAASGRHCSHTRPYGHW